MALPYSLEALVLGRSRSITPTSGEAIIPDVVISELHDDEVTVTQHPVDTGANVADHAIVQPATVTCVFGWSDSSRLINSTLDGSILQGMQTTADVYNRLLEIQRERQPLSVSTGKRNYQNMLITKLKVTTTSDTESSAVIEITFQEVFMAQAKTVALASVQQANPSKTASVRNAGHKSAIPVQGAR